MPFFLGIVGLQVAAKLTGNPILKTLATFATFGLYGVLNQQRLPHPEAEERQVKNPIPPRVRGYGVRRLHGAVQLFETDNDGNNYTVLAMADGRSDGVVQHYLNDDKITLDGLNRVVGLDDDRYRGSVVTVLSRLGLPTETNYAEVTAGLGDTIWDDTHRGDGITSAAIICKPVKSDDFNKVYPNFLPDLSIAFRLQLVWDPRDEAQDRTDPATWLYSENAALHFLDYKLNDRRVDYAIEIEPQLDSWLAAIDDCDTTVDLLAGGTEPRYRGCVLYQSTDEPATVEKELLSCFDGWCARGPDGAFVLVGGRFQAPTVSIGSAEVVSFKIKHFVTDEEALNELLVQYISADHDYAQVDCTAWRDEDDISARGAVRSDQFVPQTPSFSQNRRLAKRFMIRSNAPSSGTVTTNSAGRTVRGQRWINLTLQEDDVVFFDGVAEITRLSRDFGSLGVTFDWVEVSAAIDDWIPATEEGLGAPVGDRVASEPLPLPVITDITAQFESNGTGGQGVRLSIDVTAPDRADLTWYARWRVTGSTVWNEAQYSDIDPGASITLLTGFVTADATLDVEVGYLAGDGRFSDWSAIAPADTSTASVAPASPSITAHAGGAGTYSVAWQNPASSNFYGARVWKAATGAGFGTAADVSGLRLAAPNSADSYAPTGIAAGTYDLWVTAENSAAAQSSPAGPVTVTVT